MLVFGGITAHAVQAVRTTRFLQGRSLKDAATLSGALAMLQAELVPDTPPAAASPSYRVFLACSLLYKAIIRLVPSASQRVLSGALLSGLTR
jgi:hypothetical protein